MTTDQQVADTAVATAQAQAIAAVEIPEDVQMLLKGVELATQGLGLVAQGLMLAYMGYQKGMRG